MGVFLDKIIPLIGEVVRGGGGDEGEEGGEEEVELKEMCFQTYESLVERFLFFVFCFLLLLCCFCSCILISLSHLLPPRCPREVGGVVGQLVEEGMKYLVWDPNYTGGGEEGDGEREGEGGWGEDDDDEWEGEEWGGSDDEFEYDVEDDDMSGKVFFFFFEFLNFYVFCSFFSFFSFFSSLLQPFYPLPSFPPYLSPKNR